eukprot:14926322-Alexandrium_andersonii.AAC.1
MSASLVGSEMCIRDSPHACSSTAWHAHPHAAMQQHGKARARRRRRASVSYTHLTLPTICSV